MGDIRGGQLSEELRSLLPSPPSTPDAPTPAGHSGAPHQLVNIYANPTSRLLDSGEAELHLKQIEQQKQRNQKHQRQQEKQGAAAARSQRLEAARCSGQEHAAESSRSAAADGGGGATASREPSGQSTASWHGRAAGDGGGASDEAGRPAAAQSPLHKRLQEEAQRLARGRAGTPDFQACRVGPHGPSALCATHSHGRCYRLHWCCLLGWCHCKYVYQAFTPLERLPSTAVPARPGDAVHGRSLVRSSAVTVAADGEMPEPGSTPARCVAAAGDRQYQTSAVRRAKPGELIHSVETVV